MITYKGRRWLSCRIRALLEAKGKLDSPALCEKMLGNLAKPTQSLCGLVSGHDAPPCHLVVSSHCIFSRVQSQCSYPEAKK